MGQSEICWLGLGSNLGDRITSLRNATREIIELPAVSFVAASHVYETSPVGDGFSDPFYNAVLGVETTLRPVVLLQLCLEIEHRLGRDRSTPDRTIDIDILLFGARVLQKPELIIPHPSMHLRRFVLEPLAEVAPGLVHPLQGFTVVDLLKGMSGGEQVRRLDLELLSEE